MSVVFLAILGVVFAAAGAALLYLASPNQRAISRPPPRRACVLAGGGSELLSLLCFLAVAGPATAIFIWLTLAMTFWSVPPLLTAWSPSRKGRR